MPKDNINRAIQRGAGAADGENYEFARYGATVLRVQQLLLTV